MKPRSSFSERALGIGKAAALALAVALVATEASLAQTFDSGSDGSDGALILTDPGEVLFDPQAFEPPLDPDGDNVFHFTTINIASGVNVKLTAELLNNRPVFWLASGAVQIDGTLDLSGSNGHLANEIPADRAPSKPGPGGYSGGVGNLPGFGAAQPGNGPGGGEQANDNFSRNGSGGQTTVNGFLVPLTGGSGGGGGGTSGVIGFGGGAGGGALLLSSSLSVSVNGVIRANGGFSQSFNGFSGGGGGGGGSIRVVAPVISGTGFLFAQGGFAPRGGENGKIRLESFQFEFDLGDVRPRPTLASPFGLFLPQDIPPTVLVTRVAGQPLPAAPSADFEVPDVTIMEGGAIPFEIEARQVPPGTVVRLHLFSENGNDQIVDSTPLEGTEELSSATATVEVPPGFSRAFVRATFAP